MATSNKKTSTTSAITAAAKKPVAKVAATPASKAIAKKIAPVTKTAATAPLKKTAATAIKAATPVKKVSAPKAGKVSLPKIEKSGSKPAVTAKIAPQKSVRKNTVTPEERYHMIATAAYFRAEQRGFAGGYEMQDWISGEAQIDAMLNA